MARNQPQSLLECAAHVVGTIITEKVVDMFDKYMNTDMFHKYISVKEREEMESHITRTMEHFDEIIPKPLHDIITRHSLDHLPHDFFRKLKSDKNELNFFDIILRSHTTKLDISGLDDERSTESRLDNKRSTLCKSLTRLKKLQYLQLGPVKNENLDHVTRALKDMKNLESVECLYCCDEIVKALCNNCPLKELALCWCKQVTDVSEPYILSLQNLVKLQILHCGFSLESEFQILSGLPNLQTISYTYLEPFLAQIQDDSLVLPFKSIDFYCTTQQGIINLAKYCPLITKIDMRVIRNDTDESVNDLSGLATLRHLKSLNIEYSGLEFSDIKSLLELNGHQLIELELGWFKNTSTETENKVTSLCPNLKTLYLKREPELKCYACFPSGAVLE